MKRISIYSCIGASLLILVTSCATTKKTVEPVPVVETPVVKPEPEPETPAPAVEEDDAEYQRSTNQMEGNVTKEVFSEDKKAILQKIAELDSIMKNYDYNSWVTYIDDESISYWQDRRNLKKVSTRLPVKGLTLNSLEDYFKFVFIQSRVGRQIDEIRYISDTNVKAVQVREQQDIVYYYFHKVGGDWKLHLPPLED